MPIYGKINLNKNYANKNLRKIKADIIRYFRKAYSGLHECAESCILDTLGTENIIELIRLEAEIDIEKVFDDGSIEITVYNHEHYSDFDNILVGLAPFCNTIYIEGESEGDYWLWKIEKDENDNKFLAYKPGRIVYDD